MLGRFKRSPLRNINKPMKGRDSESDVLYAIQRRDKGYGSREYDQERHFRWAQQQQAMLIVGVYTVASVTSKPPVSEEMVRRDDLSIIKKEMAIVGVTPGETMDEFVTTWLAKRALRR